MGRSLLSAFVHGTRQVLSLQLVLSVGVVGLGGWTLAVTNELIRDRDRLRDRVIQLEEALAGRNIVVPPTAEILGHAGAETAYPPSVALPAASEAPLEPSEATLGDGAFNPGQIIVDLFGPAPPLRTIVLHARSEIDAEAARPIAEALSAAAGLRVAVAPMAARDPRPSGYSYYDGRQNRAAAALVQQFHDLARGRQVAAWSAQLRGVALPASGEFSADRLDIVLPPLPAPEPVRAPLADTSLPEPTLRPATELPPG